MKKIIITADDFGFSKGINAGTLDCVNAGTVKSVCVMTNMPYWQEISLLHAQHPEISIGIHWTVSQGKPTLPAHKVPSLVDSNGRFYDKREFQYRFVLGRINKAELRDELRTQFSSLQSLVGKVSFWNTHQNAHLFFLVHRFFCEEAQNLLIIGMRTHQTDSSGNGKTFLARLIRYPAMVTKSLILSFWSFISRRYDFILPDTILPFPIPGGADGKMTEVILKRPDGQLCEVVIHPANSVDEIIGMTTFTNSRLAEWKLFSSNESYEALVSHHVALMSFDDAIKEAGKSKD